MHRWKGNSDRRYLKNVSISRLYEQFRFRACNYFREIFKFPDFMDNNIFHKIIKVFVKSVRKIAK